MMLLCPLSFFLLLPALAFTCTASPLHAADSDLLGLLLLCLHHLLTRRRKMVKGNKALLLLPPHAHNFSFIKPLSRILKLGPASNSRAVQVKEIDELRFVLCPKRLTDQQFWGIYFQLVRSSLPPAAFSPDAPLPEAAEAAAQSAPEPGLNLRDQLRYTPLISVRASGLGFNPQPSTSAPLGTPLMHPVAIPNCSPAELPGRLSRPRQRRPDKVSQAHLLHASAARHMDQGHSPGWLLGPLTHPSMDRQLTGCLMCSGSTHHTKGLPAGEVVTYGHRTKACGSMWMTRRCMWMAYGSVGLGHQGV